MGIHPTRDIDGDDQGGESFCNSLKVSSKSERTVVKAAMLDEFKHFSPEILDIIGYYTACPAACCALTNERRSTAAKCWPLFVHEPISNWYNNRIVLIGDSVHPVRLNSNLETFLIHCQMLPFNAQGAVSAMEDGGALGYLLQDIDDPALIPERLEVFQKARADRVARVQILSNVKLGREKEVEEQVRRYADPRGSSELTQTT